MGALIGAKDVASVKPGGRLLPTISLANALAPGAEEKSIASHGSGWKPEETTLRPSSLKYVQREVPTGVA